MFSLAPVPIACAFLCSGELSREADKKG